MSNGSKNTDKQELGSMEALYLLSQMQGLNVKEDEKPAPTDEEYGIFSAGDHAGTAFKRVPKPPVGTLRQVQQIRLKCKSVASFVKEAICKDLEFPEDAVSEEYSELKMFELVLPLITRDELSDWELDHVSTAEARRMLRDFLSDT